MNPLAILAVEHLDHGRAFDSVVGTDLSVHGDVNGTKLDFVAIFDQISGCGLELGRELLGVGTPRHIERDQPDRLV